MTLCPLQKAEAAGRGRLCGSRVKAPSPRKLTSTESRRWGQPAGPGWGGPPEGQACSSRVSPQWPSPADYQLPSPPACPAFSFRARPASRPPEARARQGVLQGGRAGPWAQPLLQAPPPTGDETGPGPSTYNILPGCRLKGPCPPAFSMGRSPLLASWVGSCKVGGGGGREGWTWAAQVGTVTAPASPLQPAPRARPPTTWRTATAHGSPRHPGWPSKACGGPSATTLAPSVRSRACGVHPACRVST